MSVQEQHLTGGQSGGDEIASRRGRDRPDGTVGVPDEPEAVHDQRLPEDGLCRDTLLEPRGLERQSDAVVGIYG